jgi:xanthine dehydrogenase small subunit
MSTSSVIYGHGGNVIHAPWRGNTQTLLQHLREERRLTGTKEGCAEGDCGACMVLVGQHHPAGGPLQYRSANACFMPLTAVHGCLVVTVEDVGAPGTLHPVQQAMVEEHASQCGFCTPGIVMSLYEHYLHHPQPTSTECMHRQLSGNLCRCTGYASILRSANTMYARPHAGRDTQADLSLLQRVHAEVAQGRQALAHDEDVAHLPTSGSDVADILQAHPEAQVLAGSTDAGLWITKRLDHPRRVVHLSRAADLRQVWRDPNGLKLGAALSLTDAFVELVQEYPELDEYASRFASPAVRNWGTLGGNIANGSPIGDSMPVLLALEASLILRCGNERRILPLDDFYLAYQRTALRRSEFIEAVIIPARPEELFLRAYKVSKRYDDDITAASLVLAAQMKGGQVSNARVAMGGMAPLPRRARHTEAALLGKPFDADLLTDLSGALAFDFQPISDHRAGASYRMKVAVQLIRRAMLEHKGEPNARVIRIAKENA